jgi:hypothetical protein
VVSRRFTLSVIAYVPAASKVRDVVNLFRAPHLGQHPESRAKGQLPELLTAVAAEDPGLPTGFVLAAEEVGGGLCVEGGRYPEIRARLVGLTKGHAKAYGRPGLRKQSG